MQLLLDRLRQFKTGSDDRQVHPVFDIVLNNRASDILAIAYSCKIDRWKDHRERARLLLLEGFSIDIDMLTKSIRNICRYFGEVKAGKSPTIFPPFSIKTKFWEAFYSTLEKTRDPNAITDLVLIAAKIAHIDQLKPFVFKECKVPDFFEYLHNVNVGLRTIQGGVLSTVSNFVGQCVSINGLDVLRNHHVGEAVILLLLSPVSDLHLAGVTLVGFSFDVDGRLECLRALLENLADQALDGIFRFLQTFLEFASFLVEACSLSTTLVRCFADVLDVLCSSPGGLTHNAIFLRSEDSDGPAARIPQFWSLLTRSLSRIYNRCPIWAEFIDTSDMVTWMRDALILARDVVKQWRVLETASNSYVKAPSKPSSARLSPVGKRMVESLQEFLGELARWLRLTDEELLHQSFSLLQSLFDILKETHLKPSEVALSKLKKYVDQKAGQGPHTRRSRLDTGRLLQLSEALAFFEDDEVMEVKSAVQISRPVTKGNVQGKIRQRHIDLERPAMSTPLQHSTAKPPAIPSSELKCDGLDSDESDSSNSDSEDGVASTGLASLGKFVKSPRKQLSAKPKVVERRQIRILGGPSASKALPDRAARNQQMRNAALRLRPDISGLHKAILSWDYNHNGPVPLNNKSAKHVTDKFSSYQHYFQVFQPLLLAECWSQLSQAKEEVQDSYQCRVNNRQYVDDWLDIDLTIIESVKKGWYLAEPDIVLLHQLGDRTKGVMAKVKTYKALPNSVQVFVRCYPLPGSRESAPQLTATCQISKLFRSGNSYLLLLVLIRWQLEHTSQGICRLIIPSVQRPL